jgi:hypothetical protein
MAAARLAIPEQDMPAPYRIVGDLYKKAFCPATANDSGLFTQRNASDTVTILLRCSADLYMLMQCMGRRRVAIVSVYQLIGRSEACWTQTP